MARLEVDLALTDAGFADFPKSLEQIAAEIKAELCWLDLRNASLATLAGTRKLRVEILVEINPASSCSILLKSSEGMGNGAPLTTAVLQRLLELLRQFLPAAAVSYRSDQDGPIRK